MTKSNLKNGMTVRTANNETYVVFNNALVNNEHSLSLDFWNEDMFYVGSYAHSNGDAFSVRNDIKEVYDIMQTTFSLMLDVSNRIPIWTREQCYNLNISSAKVAFIDTEWIDNEFLTRTYINGKILSEYTIDELKTLAAKKRKIDLDISIIPF